MEFEKYKPRFRHNFQPNIMFLTKIHPYEIIDCIGSLRIISLQAMILF